MTTLALLADIHGNRPALEAVMADLAHFQVDQVVVAGDVINWGPFSAQVMARVTSEGWAVIRGNNEFYLLDYGTPRAPAAWSDTRQWPLLPWLKRQLQGRWENIVAAWPDTLSLRFPDAPPIRVVHGSARSAWESIFPGVTEAEAETLLAGIEETTVIAGHSHLSMDRSVGRWHILNPGSVGVPLDGEFYARYMLLEGDEEGWHATPRRVPLDQTPVLQEFERQRFIEECGVIGRLVVDEFRTARLQVHPFLHWRSAQRPDAALSADLLTEFETVDPWDYMPPAYVVRRSRRTLGTTGNLR
ncbi:MAG: metallophosphoesterase family protein [Anaerolineae bacterium]|nr:metallophosphoesterase family protein [Anaerolineae bacterium]